MLLNNAIFNKFVYLITSYICEKVKYFYTNKIFLAIKSFDLIDIRKL